MIKQQDLKWPYCVAAHPTEISSTCTSGTFTQIKEAGALISCGVIPIRKLVIA